MHYCTLDYNCRSSEWPQISNERDWERNSHSSFWEFIKREWCCNAGANASGRHNCYCEQSDCRIAGLISGSVSSSATKTHSCFTFQLIFILCCQGLEVLDKILEFGSVNSTNFRSLANIGFVADSSKNRPVSVVVLRDNRIVRLSITPKPWLGPGLLGCNIVLPENVDR